MLAHTLHFILFITLCVIDSSSFSIKAVGISGRTVLIKPAPRWVEKTNLLTSLGAAERPTTFRLFSDGIAAGSASMVNTERDAESDDDDSEEIDASEAETSDQILSATEKRVEADVIGASQSTSKAVRSKKELFIDPKLFEPVRVIMRPYPPRKKKGPIQPNTWRKNLPRKLKRRLKNITGQNLTETILTPDIDSK
jgi:hypothetical protein